MNIEKTIETKEKRIFEENVPKIIIENLFYDCQEVISRNSRNYYRCANR